MKIQKLKTEIANDPLSRGYASMTDEQIVNSLNTKDRSQIRPLTSATLLAWSGAGADDANSIKSRYERIKEASTSHVSGEVRGACLAALGLIQRDGTHLDLSLSDRAAMVGGLVAGGVLTPSEQTELTTLATTTISRAEELGIGWVRLGDIFQAKI